MIGGDTIVRRVDRRTWGARGLGRVAAATEFDGNSIATFSDAANGYSITLVGTAASRDLPAATGVASGAVLSWAGIPDLRGVVQGGVYPNLCRLGVRLYERQIPATAPSQIRVGVGFSDNADPLLATSGIFWCLDYPATNLRRTSIVRASGTGTWAATTATTGQAACFGVDGSFLPFSPSATDEQNALPLDSLGDLGTIGSNSARYATTYNPTWVEWTHRHLFVGWLAGTGNNGDQIIVDADIWLHEMPARAS